jgi:hypothetical protein
VRQWNHRARATLLDANACLGARRPWQRPRGCGGPEQRLDGRSSGWIGAARHTSRGTIRCLAVSGATHRRKSWFLPKKSIEVVRTPSGEGFRRTSSRGAFRNPPPPSSQRSTTRTIVHLVLTEALVGGGRAARITRLCLGIPWPAGVASSLAWEAPRRYVNVEPERRQIEGIVGLEP